MHRLARTLILLGIAAAAVSLSACAAAEKPRYARHLSAVTSPGPAANDELALAFGLDRLDDKPALLASASKAELSTH
jgi:hypothetical protein